MRHLTKSRFKTGFECPTKLYYRDDAAYGNTKQDNSFLNALAEGGFQVGELAKVYHPGGVDITTLDKKLALAQTRALLEQTSAIIYEAAFEFENLFIRADVVVKTGDRLEIIEVKAKSFDPRQENVFYDKRSLKSGAPKINAEWSPYLLDVAFQCHVVQAALPGVKVTGALMLADKSAIASVDGINQKFLLTQDHEGRTRVRVPKDLKREDLGAPLLIKVPVDPEIRLLRNTRYEMNGTSQTFTEMIAFLSNVCVQRTLVPARVGQHCKSCEFRIGAALKREGRKSGFEECWVSAHSLTSDHFARPLVFDLWMFRKAKKLVEEGVIFIDQLGEEDVEPKPRGEAGLSQSERQWLQVQAVKERRTEPYLDRAGLAADFANLVYPLHFIDFETTMVAIPFHRGRRPYEQIAFQFSHHQIDRDGRVSHRDQFISRERGKFPNVDFVRALKRALERDEGTIFRYAAHENTVLRQIREQLLAGPEDLVDRDDLVRFIDSITEYKPEKGEKIFGPRAMVDMFELVKNYYYHPSMKGSNSIKAVLPAVLASSKFLQGKYDQPIYGGPGGLESANFSNWRWIERDADGAIIDPYKRLPPIFSDLDVDDDRLGDVDGIADGGAAMTAFARMQFTEMSPRERTATTNALLKYCELDTLAMVMIWEYWNSEVNGPVGAAKS